MQTHETKRVGGSDGASPAGSGCTRLRFASVLRTKPLPSLARWRTKLLLVLLFVCLFTSVVKSQDVATVKQLLNERLYSRVDKYLKKEDKDFDNIRHYEIANRGLVGDFSEIVIYYEVQSPKGSQQFQFRAYNIQLLTHNDSIFFCSLKDTIQRQGSRNGLEYLNEMYFIDISMFNKLRAEYSTFYHRDIALSELFRNDVVYGSYCGIAGKELSEHENMRYAVSVKNIEKLERWLASPNMEVRVYAIEGFHLLAQTGYQLTLLEKQLINYVLSQQGTIRSCFGCSYSSARIKEVTKDFKFKS